MIKRFDRLDVTTTDAADAAAVYERNFGFKVRHASGSNDAIIAVGDAELRLRSGVAVADAIAASGEGLAAIWLEAEDVDQVATALRSAGIAFSAPRMEEGRRVLGIDPKATNMVPLFIFDRRV
ncbi:MAG TPA: VOC family protein [Candidatus Binataceae bacterium]|nr:VOC family protein [Candidatus Binataceae bacterium]